jgi:ryanodine receptor 2
MEVDFHVDHPYDSQSTALDKGGSESQRNTNEYPSIHRSIDRSAPSLTRYKQAMPYDPQPLDTSQVQLPAEIAGLIERLAENTHDVWARQRLNEGWSYGPKRDDTHKKHPCLVPYSQLPETEKEYDRKTAIETLKVILALGHDITKRAIGGA